MNKTLNIGKLTLAAVFGSLLWVGCASTPYEPGQPGLETTYDTHQAGPDTYPQFNHDMIVGFPYQSGWTVESIE